MLDDKSVGSHLKQSMSIYFYLTAKPKCCNAIKKPYRKTSIHETDTLYRCFKTLKCTFRVNTSSARPIMNNALRYGADVALITAKG